MSQSPPTLTGNYVLEREPPKERETSRRRADPKYREKGGEKYLPRNDNAQVNSRQVPVVKKELKKILQKQSSLERFPIKSRVMRGRVSDDHLNNDHLNLVEQGQHRDEHLAFRNLEKAVMSIYRADLKMCPLAKPSKVVTRTEARLFKLMLHCLSLQVAMGWTNLTTAAMLLLSIQLRLKQAYLCSIRRTQMSRLQVLC
jgi:hypothetical protein